MRKYLIFVPLVALLAFAIWFAIRAWNSAAGAPIPTSGYVALGLGVTFSIVIGCGLMALIFYSSRRGYDTPPQYETTDDD
jgi:hypothetical protein